MLTNSNSLSTLDNCHDFVCLEFSLYFSPQTLLVLTYDDGGAIRAPTRLLAQEKKIATQSSRTRGNCEREGEGGIEKDRHRRRRPKVRRAVVHCHCALEPPRSLAREIEDPFKGNRSVASVRACVGYLYRVTCQDCKNLPP